MLLILLVFQIDIIYNVIQRQTYTLFVLNQRSTKYVVGLNTFLVRH